MTTKPKGVMIKDMKMTENCFQCPCSMLTIDFEDLKNIKSLPVECLLGAPFTDASVVESVVDLKIPGPIRGFLFLLHMKLFPHFKFFFFALIPALNRAQVAHHAAVHFTFGTVHILHFFFQFRDFIFNDFSFFGGHVVAPYIYYREGPGFIWAQKALDSISHM